MYAAQQKFYRIFAAVISLINVSELAVAKKRQKRTSRPKRDILAAGIKKGKTMRKRDIGLFKRDLWDPYAVFPPPGEISTI